MTEIETKAKEIIARTNFFDLAQATAHEIVNGGDPLSCHIAIGEGAGGGEHSLKCRWVASIVRCALKPVQEEICQLVAANEACMRDIKLSEEIIQEQTAALSASSIRLSEGEERNAALEEAAKVAYEMRDAELSLRNLCKPGTADRQAHDCGFVTAHEIFLAIRALKSPQPTQPSGVKM